MQFAGPEQTDFQNVRAVNREFLRCLRGPAGREQRRQMAASLRPRIAALTDVDIERLSAAPFLLLSLRERDEEYWSMLSNDGRSGELLASPDSGGGAGQLGAACIAFLWQLSRRNPYATRLVSGATLSWCEQLADCTLLPVLQRMAGRADLIRPRRAGDVEFWNKLLGAGLSPERSMRRAAQLSALQFILTDDPASRYRAMRAAACSTAQPSLSLADRRPRS